MMTPGELKENQLLLAIIGFNVTVIVIYILSSLIRSSPWTYGSAFLIGFLGVLLGGAVAGGIFYVIGQMRD